MFLLKLLLLVIIGGGSWLVYMDEERDRLTFIGIVIIVLTAFTLGHLTGSGT